MRVRTRSRVSNEICLMPGRCNRALPWFALTRTSPGPARSAQTNAAETVASAITIRTTGAAGATGRGYFLLGRSCRLMDMATAPILDREEYVEQAYFFRAFRERLADNLPAQDILSRVHEELLSSTRLPYAVQFLVAELKHSGLMASGFEKLPHYFTPFQGFVVRQGGRGEAALPDGDGSSRARARGRSIAAEKHDPAGPLRLPVRDHRPQPTRLSRWHGRGRGRSGLRRGVACLYQRADRAQVGDIDFADLIYLRSELYVTEQRRADSTYEPPVPPLFGEKEGKIAKASRGREPLYLFAALQRQLGYPEVPRYNQRDDGKTRWEKFEAKLRELETRLKLAEGELRGNIDLSQFGKPDLLSDA